VTITISLVSELNFWISRGRKTRNSLKRRAYRCDLLFARRNVTNHRFSDGYEKKKRRLKSLKTEERSRNKIKNIDTFHTLFSRPSLSWSSPLTVAGDMDKAEPWGYCPKRSDDDILRVVVQDCGAGHLDTEKPRVVEWLWRWQWTCWHRRRQSIERVR